MGKSSEGENDAVNQGCSGTVAVGKSKDDWCSSDLVGVGKSKDD